MGRMSVANRKINKLFTKGEKGNSFQIFQKAQSKSESVVGNWRSGSHRITDNCKAWCISEIYGNQNLLFIRSSQVRNLADLFAFRNIAVIL